MENRTALSRGILATLLQTTEFKASQVHYGNDAESYPSLLSSYPLKLASLDADESRTSFIHKYRLSHWSCEDDGLHTLNQPWHTDRWPRATLFMGTGFDRSDL